METPINFTGGNDLKFHPLNTIIGAILKHFNDDIKLILTLAQSHKVDETFSKPGNRYFLELCKIEYAKHKDDPNYKIYDFSRDEEHKLQFTREHMPKLIEEFTFVVLNEERNLNFGNVVSFNYLISAYEAALADLLKTIYSYAPELIIDEKSQDNEGMSFNQVLKATSLKELLDEIINDKILKFGFLSPKIQITILNKILNTTTSKIPCYPINSGFVSEELIGMIIEITETRNIHVHNRGIVNRMYHEKVKYFYEEVNQKKKAKDFLQPPPHYSDASMGSFKKITNDYLVYSAKCLEEVIHKITVGLVHKFIPKEIIEHNLSKSEIIKEPTASSL